MRINQLRADLQVIQAEASVIASVSDVKRRPALQGAIQRYGLRAVEESVAMVWLRGPRTLAA